VLVWIHGGGYLLGHTGDPLFDGAAPARDGLVVVTVNYRVGFEGFGYVDGLPANRGLRDQVLALEWVQENIAAFGGDPARVTVCGQSAGAGSVASLLTGTRGRSLFRRAIAQSVPGLYLTEDLARDMTRELTKRLGREPADCDPATLAAAVTAFGDDLPRFAGRWGRVAWLATPVAPVVDGDLVLDAPWLVEPPADVDLLAGHTADEARLLLAFFEWHGPEVPAGYRATWPDATREELFERALSDVLFRMPSVALAEAHPGAYFYELTWPSPSLGAAHGVDVPLLLGTHHSPTGRMLLGSPPATGALELGAELRRAWTAFATHGDPGWERFAGSATRVFDGVSSRVEPYPEAASRGLWPDLGPYRLVAPAP
jgi:para-nitrobenzyl esterase